MTYEECEQLVTAFENATLLKNATALDDEYRRVAGRCAAAIGDGADPVFPPISISKSLKMLYAVPPS